MAKTTIDGTMVTGAVDISALDIAGATAITVPAAADLAVVADASDTNNERSITLSDLMKIITFLTAETAPATDDELAIYDTSASTADKITLINLFKVINSFTAISGVDSAADYVLVYDATDGTPKKALVENISSGGGPSVGPNSAIRVNDLEIATDTTIWYENDTVESVDTGAETLTLTGHAYSDGDLVRIKTTTTLPTGLSADTNYWVVGSAVDTIQLAASYGGSAINITGAGSGTHTVFRPQNGISAGPITIVSGTTVTVESGSTWTILGN